MSWKDLKIGDQLRLSLGLLLLLLVGLGGIGAWQAERLGQQSEHLYRTSLRVGHAIETLAADVQTARAEFRGYLLAENDEERNAALQASEAALADSEHQFTVLYERYTGPRSDLEQARETFARWRALHVGNRELVRAGRRAEAEARLKPGGDIGALRLQLLERIGKLAAFWSQRADRAFAQSEAEKTRMFRLTLAVTAAAVVLAAAMFFFLMQTIHAPLRALVDVIERFRKGERRARSGYTSTSEVGVLTGAFDELAETIETQVRIDEQAAQLAGAMLREKEPGNFCRVLLQVLTEQTGSQVGAVYLLDPARSGFECLASVGLGEALPASVPADTGSGEFGAALASGRMQRVADIPADTPFTFRVVSGVFRPRELLALPLRAGEETVGLISLGSLRPYPPAALRLLETTLGTVSAGMSGVLAYRQIQALAARLEAQNAELQLQSVELQRQQQELAAQGEELRQQSEELRGQNVELAQQRLSVEEASRLKTAFLSNMSHELRTPLNSVLVLSHLLREQAGEKLSEEQRGYLDIMARNGKHLLSLINGILDLAKIEAGCLTLEPRPFSPRLTLESLLANLDPLARAKNLELRQQIQDDLPRLESDEIRLTQILQNLVGNAIKFTDQGSVTVFARSDGIHLLVDVTDTGIGIPVDAQEMIFDEFRQVDGSPTRRYEGTGLGLAIARKTARLLGGDLSVDSRPGAGATFTLRLPLVWPHAEVPVLTLTPPTAGPTVYRPDGPRPRILLVDDNEAAILQLRGALEEAGYSVEVARAAQQACDSLAHSLPDAVVLDLMMPEVDGFALLQTIRSGPATAGLPVLVLTAKDLSAEELRRLRGANVQQLVRKGDVDRAGLLGRVNALLEPRPCVLIVEDCPDNLATVRALLQRRYRLVEATDGEAALRVAAEARPDLILLDMGLPKLDGHGVARALRRDPALRHIPILAVTAQALQGDREKALASGCQDYLVKPIDAATLGETIRRYLGEGPP